MLELKIKENINNFVDTSNAIIEYMRLTFDSGVVEFSEHARMGLNYKNNYQAQCRLIGADFPTLWYCFAVVQWFVAVMGYLETPNQSDFSKDIIKHVNTFKKTGVYIRDGKYTDDKNNLIRFKEYKEAIILIYQFLSITSELSESNQQMKELLIQRDNILKDLAKSDSFDPVRICRYCFSTFNVRTSSDKWKSCGSPKCKKAYSAATSRKSGNQPHALNKKTVSQWMKIDNTTRWCVTCGKRRLVDAKQVCKSCHDKPV